MWENDSEEKYNSLKLTIFDDSNIETDKLISMVHKISKKNEMNFNHLLSAGCLYVLMNNFEIRTRI